ncbi:MAG TPA: hypothetical protein VF169_21830 [Albitalea sp.]|uniref:hypothetical protein n=1 Tax=Piscinibacter sp. TaxID=1903157 RepID=UPI002ED5BF25
MIRASDLLTAASWSRPTDAAPRIATADAASWFDDDPVGTSIRLSSDPSPDARGLSVAQHAERVLSHLLGGPE